MSSKGKMKHIHPTVPHKELLASEKIIGGYYELHHMNLQSLSLVILLDTFLGAVTGIAVVSIICMIRHGINLPRISSKYLDRLTLLAHM